MNSHTLNIDTIEAVIAKTRENFLKLHQKFKMSETLKLHVIISHYLEYFQLTGHTLLKYTDEVTEAVHSQLRMFEECHQYKRNNKERVIEAGRCDIVDLNEDDCLKVMSEPGTKAKDISLMGLLLRPRVFITPGTTL